MANLDFNQCTTVIHGLCCMNHERPDTFETFASVHNSKTPPKHGSKPMVSPGIQPELLIVHVEWYHCQYQLKMAHGQSGRDHRLAEHHELQGGRGRCMTYLSCCSQIAALGRSSGLVRKLHAKNKYWSHGGELDLGSTLLLGIRGKD
jgi:hypothetical protein